MTVMLLYTAFSIGVIALLWFGDPKRRRTGGLPHRAHGVALRRALLGLALVPGATLAAMGDAAAFLVWLGGCAIGGWLIAQARTGQANQGSTDS